MRLPVQIFCSSDKFKPKLTNSFDGGPDPHAAFGKDEVYDPGTLLGALLSLTGKQRYALPSTMPSTMPSNIFNEVYICCEVASVPLGVASLN